MKLLVVLCLAVAVSADPQFVNPWFTGVQQPLAYHQPLVYHQPAVVGLQHAVEKTEQESEGGVKLETNKNVVQPVVYNQVPAFSPFYHHLGVPVVQPTKILPKYKATNGDLVHEVYKREADPAYFYNNAFGYNYAAPHAAVYNPAFYSHAGAFGYPQYYAQHSLYQPTNGVTNVANDRNVLTPNYAAKGTYAAVTAGSAHFAKRDADADPAVFYNRHYGYGYPHATAYGYPSAYSTYGRTYGYPYASTYGTYGRFGYY